MALATSKMSAPVESTICPICSRPVRVLSQPGQRFRRLADHGKQIGVLCKGAGMPAPKETK